MSITRMNSETALIPPAFASNALKIVSMPLDAHGTSLLHAVAGCKQKILLLFSNLTRLQLTVPLLSPVSLRTSTTTQQIRDSTRATQTVARPLSGSSSIQSPNFSNHQSFLRAAMAGQLSMVQWLLASSCDMDAADTQGLTALIAAVTHGHTHVVECLLGASCDASATDASLQSALHVAASACNTALLSLLLPQRCLLHCCFSRFSHHCAVDPC
jgi:ankyrin repeat protein